MANVEIKLNSAGIRELLRSKEAAEVCKEQADKAQSRLGDGYIVTTYTGKGRVNASVYAESYAAKRDNAENNTILKALKG